MLLGVDDTCDVEEQHIQDDDEAKVWGAHGKGLQIPHESLTVSEHGLLFVIYRVHADYTLEFLPHIVVMML